MAGNENLTILFADILKTDIKALVEEEFSGLRPMACANLPYYITTPVLAALLESRAFEAVTMRRGGTSILLAFASYIGYYIIYNLLLYAAELLIK